MEWEKASGLPKTAQTVVPPALSLGEQKQSNRLDYFVSDLHNAYDE